MPAPKPARKPALPRYCIAKERFTDHADEVERRLDALEELLKNGLSERIAESVSSAFAEESKKEWEREREERAHQLEEQREANRKYGHERDRKMKIMIALIATVGVPVVSVLTPLIQRFFMMTFE